MNLNAVGLERAVDLARAHALAFDRSWNAAEFASLLNGPGVAAILAEGDGPLGLVLIRSIAGEAEILTLGVAPTARRKGQARALMNAAMGLARQTGAERLFLEVAEDNAPALRLYAALGFREMGRRKGYYDRGAGVRADALVLHLDVI